MLRQSSEKEPLSGAGISASLPPARARIAFLRRAAFLSEKRRWRRRPRARQGLFPLRPSVRGPFSARAQRVVPSPSPRSLAAIQSRPRVLRGKEASLEGENEERNSRFGGEDADKLFSGRRRGLLLLCPTQVLLLPEALEGDLSLVRLTRPLSGSLKEQKMPPASQLLFAVALVAGSSAALMKGTQQLSSPISLSPPLARSHASMSRWSSILSPTRP